MLVQSVLRLCGLDLCSLRMQYIAMQCLASSSCNGRLVLSQDRVTRQSSSCPCRCRGMLVQAVLRLCDFDICSLRMQYIAVQYIASSSCDGRLVLSQDE